MHADENEANRWTALIGLSLLLMIAAGIFGAILTAVDAMRPRPGDIVSFAAGQTVPSNFVAPLTAQRQDGGSCALDPAVMAAGGGSLVVEGTQHDRTLVVNWAGSRSAATQDCGRTARLLIPEDTLDALAAAAGGYGVAHKTLALSSMPTNAMI